MTSCKPQHRNKHRQWPLLASNFGSPAVGDENCLLSKVGGKSSPHLTDHSCVLCGTSATQALHDHAFLF